MTTTDDGGTALTGEHYERLTKNLAKVEELSRRLVGAVAQREPHNAALDAPNHELFASAATAYWTEMLKNPTKVIEQQVEYWGKTVNHFAEAQQALLQGMPGLAAEAEDEDPPQDVSNDPRFKNPLWQTHPYFRFVRQQYEANAKAIEDAVASVTDLDDREKQRLNYFSRQIVDMMSPNNFLGTNPDALEMALETDGQSLIDGLENLVNDLEANDGELVVRLADEKAFELGGNVATTPGQIVYRNRMMELIQYEPTTEKVHEVPLIIFPPWINKFYILDLKAQNSLIKWITDQGYTLFVVSWVNPGADYADVGMDNYVDEGFLTAIREVKAITGQPKVNAIGYCIAGTTLAMTLALLRQRKDTSVKSATFFTALTDFSDQGEFTPFLSDDFIDGIENEVQTQGFLRSFIMARTFSYLRSNDLVYGPAIRSYMLGKAPPAFDLLFWNGDGSNLPGRMAIEYLRGLCQKNNFAGDGYSLLGHTVKLSEVNVPLCSIACETDHIAAWKDVFRGVQQMGGKDRTFILTESGHIAGIVNPPSKKKYGHYTNPELGLTAEDWQESADFNEGSWWPNWEKWLRKRSGKKVAARTPGDADHPVLAPAPGTYVRKKTSD